MGSHNMGALWGRYCVECLGEISDIRLSRKDCCFSRLSVGSCCKCGRMCHYVMDVKFPVKYNLWIKLLFKNR